MIGRAGAGGREQASSSHRAIATWRLAATAAGEFATPAGLDAAPLEWIEAEAPGTVAAALQRAGRWDAQSPAPLHGRDYWWLAGIEGEGRATLALDGLATVAEVWLDDRRIAESRSMFQPLSIEIDVGGKARLAIVFRSLTKALAEAPRKPRARWRPRLISSQSLRFVRTTLAGHMPGWCPPIDAIGPWREVRLVPRGGQRIVEQNVRALADGDDGIIEASVRLALPAKGGVRLRSEAHAGELRETEPGLWQGRLVVPKADRWWPHTHGTPRLYAVTLDAGTASFDLGRTGFRSIEIDRGADGRAFRLLVNGTPVFARGAVWTSADLVSLSGTRQSYAPWLAEMRRANLNMVRVPGTLVYEAKPFHDLCDELGILVWQDFMFANMDYPDTDASFAAAVAAEADAFLGARQLSPSLAVLCGGSEVHQQATMLGYPPAVTRQALFDELLPGRVRALRPDVPYVANSPSGGTLPFSVGSGVAHYFGVGAYLRPLDDARRARVPFASECLTFANIPDPITRDAALAGIGMAEPAWKARSPRDLGTSWDFEDVRDHYLGTLYGVDPRLLRREDPELYDLASRAVIADVFEATLGEWRSGGVTAGALVLTLQDLVPGAGWGIVDSLGEPKSPWHAMRRTMAPTALLVTDEGLDGLLFHAVNDTATPRALRLELTCLRDGLTPVIEARRDIDLAPRQTLRLGSAEVIGQFFDINGAYRFGPASHDVTIARLVDRETGSIAGEAVQLTSLRLRDRSSLGLAARLVADAAEGWTLEVSAERFARRVVVDDRSFRPDDNYFHVQPGRPVRLRLAKRPATADDGVPSGSVTALNSVDSARYG